MIGRQVYFRRYCPTGYGYCTLMLDELFLSGMNPMTLHEFADANVQLDWQALPRNHSESPKAPDCRLSLLRRETHEV